MGKKHWANTWTEIEDLGNGKFAAEVHVGHRVFKDKADGLYKKHKLTDERPAKDYVLIQSAKCCVEIYPYYAKYFDIQHEEVRLHEERWVVQRLFKAPDKWKDVGAWNPVINVEEYSEPAGDVVKVTITYDTDYGTLTIEYFQRDGNTLKHNISFKNTSSNEETFRVLQKWAGIVGNKCNGKDMPVIEDFPYLAFHDSDKPKKKFNIAENLHSMVFNEDGSEKDDQCLQRPISIETHAQGMKTDFVYGNWTLASDESLKIDPDTATLDDPTEDGHIFHETSPAGGYIRTNTYEAFWMSYRAYPGEPIWRAYVEWSIADVFTGGTITDAIFKYHGFSHVIDCHIHAMASQPSVQSDNDAGNQIIYDDAGDGTVYADPDGFPVVATNQQVDLGASADSDLQSAVDAERSWFAIGLQSDNEAQDGYISGIRSEDKTDAATPKPTLYVVYTVAVEFEYVGTGSFAYSGSAITIIGFTSVGSGELNYSGTATQTYTRDYLTTASGQLVYSGSAEQVYSKDYLYSGSGELAFSGEAVIIVGLAFVGGGSLAYSGEAVVTYTLNYLCTAVGELIYSGEAIFSYLCNFLFSGSGELAYSGEAEQSYTYNFSYVASGNFVTSGSGICQYEIPDWEYVGSGSFNYSGEGAYSIEFSYIGSGDFVYIGAGTHILGISYMGIGTFYYSGSAITTIGFTYSSSGELNYSGEAIQSHTTDFVYDTSGSFIFSGIGIYSIGFAFTGEGSFTYSGEAIQTYTFNYFCVGAGEFVYSGSAIQIHTRYYLYEGSGDFTYSGTAITTVGFVYIGSGDFVFSGEATQSYTFNLNTVGTGSFNFSGSGSYYYEISDWEYVGSGVFNYSGKAFHRWGDWAHLDKKETDFTKVDKKTSNWSKVEKGESDWKKTRKV